MIAVASSVSTVSMQGIVQILAAQFAAFLAFLLAASAAHKWYRWKDTIGVVRDFGGVPRGAAPPAALAVGLTEWMAAALLVSPSYRVLGALVAASILTVYLALIARSLMAGRRDVDCGCSFGAARHSLGAFEVVRNSVLAVMALFVAASTADGGAAIAASQVLAAAVMLALYGALDQAMGLRPMRRGTVL